MSALVELLHAAAAVVAACGDLAETLRKWRRDEHARRFDERLFDALTRVQESDGSVAVRPVEHARTATFEASIRGHEIYPPALHPTPLEVNDGSHD